MLTHSEKVLLATGFIVLMLLVLCSAFFSGIESAFISLGEIDMIEVEKSKSKNKKILLRLLENRERLLSTILVGNNLANIAASAWNTALAIKYAPVFGISEELSVSLSAIMLTLIILMFGEITPKSIAIVHNRTLALWTAPLIMGVSTLFFPVTYFFDKISKFLNRVFLGKGRGYSITESTVINVVSKGEELGVINKTEKDLIQNVFQFDEREVYPIMTPRPAVFALEESKTLSEAQDKLLSRKFSRIPIYKDSIDNITGVVNLKNIFQEILSGNGETPLKDLSQKAIFIYETLSLSTLLEQFQQEQTHMAVVVDEFGGMAGIVTLEDILEELVGEIYDEKDTKVPQIRKISEGKWAIQGRADIVSINKAILGELDLTAEYETLQGLIMSSLEKIPSVGDTCKVGDHQFTVVQMKNNEIVSARVEYIVPSDDDNKEEEDESKKKKNGKS